MAIKDRREREKLERKNSILGAATELFWEKGYEATMDEIADRAELSKPTLYLYFRNKDDLYASIAIEGFKSLKERFRGIASSSRDPEEKYRAMYEGFIAFVVEHKQVSRITEFVLSEKGRKKLSGEVMEKIDEDTAQLLSLAAGVIGEGVEAGVFAGGMDPLVTALVLWRSMLGVASLAIEGSLTSGGEDPYQELFESALVVLTEGIRKR